MRLLLRTLRYAVYALLAVLLLLIAIRAGLALYHWLPPKTWYIAGSDLDAYREAGVPEQAVERLNALRDRNFEHRRALLRAARRTVGEATYTRHAEVLGEHLHTRKCWANESTRPVYPVRSSRGHRLYDRFRWAPALPVEAGPEIVTNLIFLPGGDRILLGKLGDVVLLDAQWNELGRFRIPESFHEIKGDQGALGIALDPDFATNRFVYISHVGTNNETNWVQRFTYSRDAQAMLASRVTTLRIRKDSSERYHGISALHFTADGALLVLVGAPASPLAQRPWELQGKLLGIIPGRGPEGGYAPAQGWLTSLLSGRRPPVVATGFRSPYSATPWRDGLLIGDVGAGGPHSYEEINLYRTPGQNFGWGICDDPAYHNGYSPPVIAYRRGDARTLADLPGGANGAPTARSVVVGTAYPDDGSADDPYAGTLDGRVLYTEFYAGFVRAARLAPSDGRVTDDVLLNKRSHISNMRRGPDGYVYATLAFGAQAVLRLEPAAGLAGAAEQQGGRAGRRRH